MMNMSSADIPFNVLDRKMRISEIGDKYFDLIVIGGGITGAGIALDASLRGLSVILIEKGDFASGTSSKSSKLIHGGLRYLKQFEFGLVRKTGTERAVLHRNAPHLVHPETMLLPIVTDGEFNKYTASLAISVYDWLAGVEQKNRKKSLSFKQTEEAEPLLNRKILKSAISYSEYRTDDSRLTLEVIKAARRESAEAFNYLEVDDFIYESGKVVGVNVEDKLDSSKYAIRGKFVVSAAGPWVDNLRKKDQSAKGKSLHLTKGVHIVLDKSNLPIKHAVYFDAFDGRMIFAIPRGKVTYVGTSDTNYIGDLNRVLCSVEDVEYLLSSANKMFSDVALTRKDVISSWAGLRPLIHEDGKSPSELSRKDEIFISEQNLISIAGGKLTGFRLMSKKIVDLLQRKDKSLPQASCATKHKLIHADSFNGYTEFVDFWFTQHKKYKDEGLTKYLSWYLTTTFGKNAEFIIKYALTIDADTFEEAIIKAEITYCIQYESACLPDDYFNRRTGRLYFDISSVKNHFELIVNEFAAAFSWSAEKTTEEQSKARTLIEDVTIFK